MEVVETGNVKHPRFTTSSAGEANNKPQSFRFRTRLLEEGRGKESPTSLTNRQIRTQEFVSLCLAILLGVTQLTFRMKEREMNQAIF
jgi:hypothetical protein